LLQRGFHSWAATMPAFSQTVIPGDAHREGAHSGSVWAIQVVGPNWM
jgi:hypothetical protein